MLHSIADAGLFALQGVLPDTIVTINAEPPAGVFDRISGIASGLEIP